MILGEVFKRALENSVRFNIDKIKYQVSSVRYMHHIISQQGVKVDPEKVKAITNMPPPTSLADLRRLMGMLAYIVKFVPMLAEYTEPLRHLLKKNYFLMIINPYNCFGQDQ